MLKVQTKMLNVSLDFTLFFLFRKYEKLPLPTSFRIMLYYTIFEDKFWPQRRSENCIKQSPLYSTRTLTNSLAHNGISVTEYQAVQKGIWRDFHKVKGYTELAWKDQVFCYHPTRWTCLRLNFLLINSALKMLKEY